MFGATIWTISQPGHVTSYYRPSILVANSTILETRVIIPHWCGNLRHKKSTSENLEELSRTGQLQLRKDTQSGYSFRRYSSIDESQSKLYIRGRKQQNLLCRMLYDSQFIIWTTNRPQREAYEGTKRGRRGLEMRSRPPKAYAGPDRVDTTVWALNHFDTCMFPAVQVDEEEWGEDGDGNYGGAEGTEQADTQEDVGQL